jgi:excinuclease ABC subunit C
MPIPDLLKTHFEALPDAPGVYIYKDEKGREIYVGKAISLRKRVRQYFDDKRPIDIKTADLVARINAIDFIECKSEVEAYLLENRLIKDLQPPFNMRSKSDVNFPVVEITGEEFPRVIVTRDRSNKHSKYYGPFVSAGWLREALRVLQRVFKYRTCNLDIKENDPKNRFFRPCLEYYIGRCKAPCANLQSSADYKADLRRLALFLQGRSGEVEKELQREMKLASKTRRYEDAAALRDTLKALQSLRDRGSLTDGLEPGVLHIDPKTGVAQLQEVLGLAIAPRHIEGIDIAHLHGDETVGSLVSFLDGLPTREQYRRFRIKTVQGIDDFASIREIVSRRYGRLIREGSKLPDLILIDGGIGQLHAALGAIRELSGKTTEETAKKDLSLSPQSSVLSPSALGSVVLASLAKKEEIIYTLDHPDGVRMARRSPALRMLQYVRDEAHRFARHYHHILRRKRVMDE